mmetsp:Transcript_19873/g.67316  ORF Transcript_19873/g.67316 Transcript_19873/m.67316 type:complete len:200 (-) Transcript_19873:201-800(-)
MASTLRTLAALGLVASALAFAPRPRVAVPVRQMQATSALWAVRNDDFAKANRAARGASAGDRVVELNMPLGLDLEEDESGNVYVAKVRPGSNAAKSGAVFKGDIIAMCSATFGDEMWNTRGVGLARVTSTIQIRAGGDIKLVLEGTAEAEKKRARALDAAAAKRAKEQAAKDARKSDLEAQLKADDEELKKKRGPFGLW